MRVLLAGMMAIVLAGCGDDSSTVSEVGPELGADLATDLAGDEPMPDAGDVDAAASPFPPPAALPEVEDPFAVLEDADGTAIDAAAWPAERTRLIDLFSQYIYGVAPNVMAITSEVLTRASDVDGAEYEEVAITVGPLTIHLALFRPPGSEPTPVILALNKCGNQTVSTDARVRQTTSRIIAGCGSRTPDGTVGLRDESWPVDAIVARGFTLATFHESDVRPDLPSDRGASAELEVDAPEDRRWGALAQWAWGLRHAVSYLASDSRIDSAQIALTGHSRRGKAALWAAALDERVAIVMPHQSGTMGASLTRGGTGETVSDIALVFPHWFAPVFQGFRDAPSRLPVDQHQLVALVAPRSLLSSNGADDFRADPPSALRAAELADPVWELLGSDGLMLVDSEPEFEGTLSWFTRDGGHSIEMRDWTTFLDYASSQLSE
ncbi:MAG: hypothetical protein AAF411_02010 [Myxococcota bacterium]